MVAILKVQQHAEFLPFRGDVCASVPGRFSEHMRECNSLRLKVAFFSYKPESWSVADEYALVGCLGRKKEGGRKLRENMRATGRV